MGNVTKLQQPVTQKVPLPVPRPANLTPAPAAPTTAPATAPAKTTTADAKPVAGQPQTQPQTQVPDSAQVNLQKGTATTSVALFDEHPAPPPPPALLKNGDIGDNVAELNKLLRRTGAIRHATDVFTPDTEKAIKAFQRDNGLPVTGGVDATTLRKLIESTKMDEANFPKLEALLGVTFPTKPATTAPKPGTQPAKPPVQPIKPPVQPVKPPATQTNPPATEPAVTPAEPTAPVAPPKVYANEAERIKDVVAGQIAAKGRSAEHAFAVGANLRAAATNWDKKMPSSSLCYTAVKRAIDDALKIPYQVFGGKAGTWAKTAGTNLLSKAPEFVKIEGLKRADLTSLPAGAVIVYKPAKGPGHIGVQNGSGQDISDKTRTQANVYRGAPFEVYFPVGIRGEDPVPNPDAQSLLVTEPTTSVG